MYVIKFTEKQLGFLMNDLDIRDYEKEAWYILMDNLCWDEKAQEFKPENPLILNEEQREEFYRDMVANGQEILRKMDLDVRYHSISDTFWSCHIWSLKLTSDILKAIQDAEVIA